MTNDDQDAGLRLHDLDHEAAAADRRRQVLDDLGITLRADAEWDAFATELALAFAAELGHGGRTPVAMVNLVTDQQVFVGLHSGAKEVDRTMPVDHGYCPEVVERGKALVLPDTYAHPRFASNPVVDQIGIRTYAGAPLIHQSPDGEIVLGTVCIVDDEPRPRSTGNASRTLIKHYRDALMTRLYQRIGHHPANTPANTPAAGTAKSRGLG